MNRNLGKKIVSVALLGSMCAYTMPVFANTKEETVYSKLDTSGNEYSTIVSEKLSNDGSSELINDISELMNIMEKKSMLKTSLEKKEKSK